MAGTFLKWFVPALLTVVGGTVLAVAQTGAAVTGNLDTQATAALAPPEFSWASVRIDGRDAVLSGTATTPKMIDDAVARVAAIPGVRAVQSDIALAQLITPFVFGASLDAGAVTLTGAYPDEPTHTALKTALVNPDDQTRLYSGAPAGFEGGARFVLAALSQMDQGDVKLSDTRLSVSGRAKSLAALDSLEALPHTVPAGFQLVSLTISPPQASPYVWTAKFDGTAITVTGNAPTADLADKLRAVAPANVPLAASLTLASGEPSGFDANTIVLLSSLLKLERGEASINDGTVTLSGAPATAAVGDEVTAALTHLGGTATLEPPRVAAYEMSIDKANGHLTFAGYVPDAALRQKLAALDGADVQTLALGRGAPDHFSDALDFGLAVLGHLADGRFAISGSKIIVGGHAPTVAEFTAAQDRVGQGAPSGLSVAAAEIHPPVANPFTWSAIKDQAGRITFSGFVPDDAARRSLLAKATVLAADNTQPADGAPADFALSAGKGLEVLALLDAGTLSFDGKSWSIDGTASNAKKGFAADSAYSVAGLRTAGWNYTVHLPPLPTIAPYIWRAQKTADGRVSFTGFAPAETFQAAVRDRVPGGSDSTTLGAGAPRDFDASALSGLDALLTLDEGTLALGGNHWSLTGVVDDSVTRRHVQAKLAAAVDTTNWQVAIQAKDEASIVSPYLWSATKANDGSVSLSGYVPSDDLKALAEKNAVTVSQDTLTIAAGEPAGFNGDMAAGLAALAQLTDGRASFDGSKWLLTGDIAATSDGDAAVAALSKGSLDGGLWTAAITGYPPPSSSEPPAATSASSSSAESGAGMSSSSGTSSAEDSSPAAPSVSAEDITSIAPPSSVSSEEMTREAPPAELSSSSSASALASSVPEASSSAAGPSSSSAEESSSAVLSSTESEPSSSASVAEASSSASSSSEAVSSSTPPSSLEASSSASSAAAEQPSSIAPITPTSLNAVPPLPKSLVFAASRAHGGAITLKGGVANQDSIASFGGAAGDVSTDNLAVVDGLPDDFGDSALAGLGALTHLNDGDLGFDGARWWLHGHAASQPDKDTVNTAIAALPGGKEWSLAIDLLAPIDLCRDRVGSLAGRNAILFKGGGSTLLASSMPVIDELADDLKTCPKTSVHVQGHTDADGDPDTNLALSVARAETVVAELVKRGVDEGRLYAEGYGESDPIAPNDTKDNKARNRRIAFTISEQ